MSERGAARAKLRSLRAGAPDSRERGQEGWGARGIRARVRERGVACGASGSGVVVYRYDRFARSLRQLVTTLCEFDALRIQFVFASRRG
jgi:hypothetical protein